MTNTFDENIKRVKFTVFLFQIHEMNIRKSSKYSVPENEAFELFDMRGVTEMEVGLAYYHKYQVI